MERGEGADEVCVEGGIREVSGRLGNGQRSGK